MRAITAGFRVILKCTIPVETHPYAGGSRRSRARRIVSHLRALFKGVGRSPRPRQPGATGSNAYCLAQRCTTGSVPSPYPSPLCPPNGACNDTTEQRRISSWRKLPEYFDVRYLAAAACHFHVDDGLTANQTAAINGDTDPLMSPRITRSLINNWLAHVTGRRLCNRDRAACTLYDGILIGSWAHYRQRFSGAYDRRTTLLVSIRW